MRAVLTALCALPLAASAQAADPPHIVMFIADDLGWADPQRAQPAGRAGSACAPSRPASPPYLYLGS